MAARYFPNECNMTSPVASPYEPRSVQLPLPCQVCLTKPEAISAMRLHKVSATSEERRIAVTSVNKSMTTA